MPPGTAALSLSKNSTTEVSVSEIRIPFQFFKTVRDSRYEGISVIVRGTRLYCVAIFEICRHGRINR
jgi:hypothetical protein